ncbi:cell division protein FtsK [Sporosarcina globispora]|uniref:Cell division protein FtsK n=1 Tax=Sporosarcina globispora TaxID=1459 RepID=A0A0M0GHW6_SPOGL|nr:DNA translocase FtsK [Sporosarcina globispora]KON89031.1 cell division protein FtsK [Sporosarcina globispora]
MAKRKRRKSKKSETLKRTMKFELIGLMLLSLGVVALADFGRVSDWTVLFFRFFFGNWDIIGILGMMLFGTYLMWKRAIPPLFTSRLIGVYLVIGATLILSHTNYVELITTDGRTNNPSIIKHTYETFIMIKNGETSTTQLNGGMIGAVLLAVLYYLFDVSGSKFISFIMIVIGFILITGRTFGETIGKIFNGVLSFIKKQWAAFIEDCKSWIQNLKDRNEERRTQKEERRAQREEQLALQQEEETETVITINNSSEPVSPPMPEPIISSFAERAYQEQPQEAPDSEPDDEKAPPITFTEVENKDYELPPIRLLKLPRQTDQSGEYELIHANAAKLERTFQSFGVKARVTQVHLGPAVTKYEVHPDVGVKVSKIVSLNDDLALALAAKDIRIEAPIPGKSAIGIEVPNSEVAMVSLREVIESKQNDKPDSKLLIGLGRDITGEAVLAELNKMPHLLVAGATGSGKSVCINGIITSILMRAKPHEVKLMMIDPKMVELNVYNGVPHLLAPVVTNPKKAAQALQKVVSEMERRYELFSHTGTRNIEGYNDYVKRHNAEEEAQQPLLPYIVVIVDELADLMMVASSDVEDAITRLAQMARAAGIHLIIATQRPSVDVITGVIKANIPSRIAFAVSSMTDSRTILDMGGAEKLLGRGDMLFLPVGASKPVRVQGAFLSDDEVEEIVDFVIGQQKAQYQEEMIPEDIPEAAGEVDDDLYDEAVELILEMQTASVSMLQRRFRIGYTRAARLIDEMEARGIVGPYEGSKPRAVLQGKPSEEASS